MWILRVGTFLSMLLLIVPATSAAIRTFTFNGHLTEVTTDNGIALPAGIEVGAAFSGSFSFSTNNVYGPYFFPDDYDFGPYSIDRAALIISEHLPLSSSIQIGSTTFGGVTAQQEFPIPNSAYTGIYDNVQVEEGYEDQIAFSYWLQSNASSYLFGEDVFGQSSVIFSDSKAVATDPFFSGAPIESGWTIPAEDFDSILLYLTIFEQSIPVDGTIEYRNYFRLVGQAITFQEVPVPAAGPLFATLLLILGTVRRRGLVKARGKMD